MRKIDLNLRKFNLQMGVLIIAAMVLIPAAILFAAQHDYNIANAPGAVVRADINNAYSAVATNNSAATEPATTFANQWWFDSSTNILKQRNNANDAWINVALKDGTGWTPYRQGTQIGTGALLTTDTDTALAADSDSNVPTQKAVKAYADAVQTSTDTKISKTIAGEIAAMTEKVTLVDGDLFLIEDSEDSNSKKKVQKSNVSQIVPFGLQFVSKTTMVAGTATSDIAIEEGKKYRVIMFASRNANVTDVFLRFNNDAAEDYSWNEHEIIDGTTSSDNSDNQIWIVFSSDQHIGTQFTADFIIAEDANTEDAYYIQGDWWSAETQTSAGHYGFFVGDWDDNEAVTSFDFTFNHSVDVEVLLYEIIES